MIRRAIGMALIAAALPHTSLAQGKQLADVGGYCEVVEKQIVALANTASSANDDLAKFARDQPTADPVRFGKANALLATITESLKDKELEWYHLGCTQILYRRAASSESR